MKSLAELDQFDLESASKQQVAALVQALLEQVKKDLISKILQLGEANMPGEVQ